MSPSTRTVDEKTELVTVPAARERQARETMPAIADKRNELNAVHNQNNCNWFPLLGVGLSDTGIGPVAENAARHIQIR